MCGDTLFKVEHIAGNASPPDLKPHRTAQICRLETHAIDVVTPVQDMETIMNRILIASALALGLAGTAIAQEAPFYPGDFGPSVDRQLNGHLRFDDAPAGESEIRAHGYAAPVDATTTGSVSSADAALQADRSFNINLDQRYSGR